MSKRDEEMKKPTETQAGLAPPPGRRGAPVGETQPLDRTASDVGAGGEDADPARMTWAYGRPYKVCKVCGKVYPDRRTYLLETEPVTGNPAYPNGHMPSDEGEEWFYELRNCSCGATLAERLRSERDLSPIGKLRRNLFSDVMDYYRSKYKLDRQAAWQKVMDTYEAFFRAHLKTGRLPSAGPQDQRGPWDRGGPRSAHLGRLLDARGFGAGARYELDEEIWKTFGRTAAVLVLDASGFSRITKAQGIVHFLSLVADMRRRLWPVFDQYGALARWAEADNMYGAFETAEDAIRCAMACQRNTTVANAGREEADRLNVCIGVGYGELLLIGEEDVFGDEMNLASKLGEDIAGPGEILLTAKAWNAAAEAFPNLPVEERSLEISGVRIAYYKVLEY